MAVTKIWKIKNNLKHSINYVINPEKTLNTEYGKEIYDEFHTDDKPNYKNELSHYVTGVNCLADTAYEDMMFTKEQYNKNDGIIAYHAYQSFNDNITPELAHEIGVKLAEEMWNDFEVVVATHQNTKHIHNHFIINSVSYFTGKKYNNNRPNLAKLRHISDNLCEEYGLSTLNEKQEYKNTYKYKVLENDYYKIVKDDIDEILSYSITYKQFISRLKKSGYQVYTYYGKLTVYKEGFDKVRIEKAFGKDYSIGKIQDKLQKNSYSNQIAFSPKSQKSIFEKYLTTTKNTHKGILGLYYYYCYLLGVFPKEHPKQYLPYSIRKEIKKMEQYSEEARFMVSNKIETKDDLENFLKNTEEQYFKLTSDRANMWTKCRRAKTDDIKNEIKSEIDKIQPKIKELRKQIKYCKSIKERSETIKNNIDNFDRDLVKEKDKSMVR